MDGRSILVHTSCMRDFGSSVLAMALACIAAPAWPAATQPPIAAQRPIAELKPLATFKLGKTADWVAITADAVWVASTGPYAVHRIDPRTNTRIASVDLPGEPCAGLAVGSGSLWVPLCTTPTSLAKVNLATNRLEANFGVGPAAAEGGIAFGAGTVWLIINESG